MVSSPAQDVSGTTAHKTAGTPNDWRQQRLAEAAHKYGKPFKCASDDMPREVIVGGKHLIAVGSGRGAWRGTDTVGEQQD